MKLPLNYDSCDVACPHCRSRFGVNWGYTGGDPEPGLYEATCLSCDLLFEFEVSPPRYTTIDPSVPVHRLYQKRFTEMRGMAAEAEREYAAAVARIEALEVRIMELQRELQKAYEEKHPNGETK